MIQRFEYKIIYSKEIGGKIVTQQPSVGCLYTFSLVGIATRIHPTLPPVRNLYFIVWLSFAEAETLHTNSVTAISISDY